MAKKKRSVNRGKTRKSTNLKKKVAGKKPSSKKVVKKKKTTVKRVDVSKKTSASVKAAQNAPITLTQVVNSAVQALHPDQPLVVSDMNLQTGEPLTEGDFNSNNSEEFDVDNNPTPIEENDKQMDLGIDKQIEDENNEIDEDLF